MAKIDDIVEDFALLDEWDDRYRYVIELGRFHDGQARLELGEDGDRFVSRLTLPIVSKASPDDSTRGQA